MISNWKVCMIFGVIYLSWKYTWCIRVSLLWIVVALRNYKIFLIITFANLYCICNVLYLCVYTCNTRKVYYVTLWTVLWSDVGKMLQCFNIGQTKIQEVISLYSNMWCNIKIFFETAQQCHTPYMLNIGTTHECRTVGSKSNQHGFLWLANKPHCVLLTV